MAFSGNVPVIILEAILNRTPTTSALPPLSGMARTRCITPKTTSVALPAHYSEARKPQAITAAAHKLARIVSHLLKTKESYNEGVFHRCAEENPEAR
jgi:hypothetical protein